MSRSQCRPLLKSRLLRRIVFALRWLRSFITNIPTKKPFLRLLKMSSCYLTRIIPALSVVSIVILLLFSLVMAPYGKIEIGERHATTSQLILGVYTVFLHVLSIVFPARVCWSIGDVTQKMKEAASITEKPKRHKTRSAKNMEFTIAESDPLFVIIIPAYKEAVETLEETLRVLASHPQAFHYHVRARPELRANGGAYLVNRSIWKSPVEMGIANNARSTWRWKREKIIRRARLSIL